MKEKTLSKKCKENCDSDRFNGFERFDFINYVRSDNGKCRFVEKPDFSKLTIESSVVDLLIALFLERIGTESNMVRFVS